MAVSDAALPEARMKLIMELRRAHISDIEVLKAIERTPRELFVPAAFKEHAYENAALPIGKDQTISQPEVVALMTQALDLNDRIKILEIGTGSGYQTVILSYLCRRVYTIERHRPLLDEAEARFTRLRRHNVTTRCGDGGLGWPEQAPFERILVTAAAHDIPPILLDQLAVGGMMILPVGDDYAEQNLLKVTRTEGAPQIENLGSVKFVPLVAGQPDD